MAVGHFPFPDMQRVAGVRLATASAGIKTPGRRDIVLIELSSGSRVAGVFTQNAYCAAPVTVARQHLSASRDGNSRHYLVINSGNANACTGATGLADARKTCASIGELAGVNAEHVLPFSTGVIGELLPMEKIFRALPDAYAELSPDRWAEAAQGIMTTDTRPKGASVRFEHNGETITVNGIAKGAGMIKPNMATMLAYVITDAKVAQPVVEQLVKKAVEQSFNRITIDGDTSTNDACILAATGQTPLPEITDAAGDLYGKLYEAVVAVHIQLAQAIVSDGEGATKFVTVEVGGGASRKECLDVAFTVAESPLVKTALFASDANWGRIVAAIGRAGVEQLDAEAVTVHLGDVLIVEKGGRAAGYTEEQGQRLMRREEITIRIHLGRGGYAERVWTTDLTHDYVTINGAYRT